MGKPDCRVVIDFYADGKVACVCVNGVEVRVAMECREVKRHANPGEYIKIVAPLADREDCKIGTILRVSDFPYPVSDGRVYYKDELGGYVWDEEYVVLEGYQPAEK